MGLRLPDHWVWDFWHAHDGERHHLFYLQAPRSLGDPEQRHWHVTVGHAVSDDLRSWDVLPDALAPAAPGAWDDCTTWTGSILRHDGLWWMFYTGTRRAEDGLVQRIGSATSPDLTAWERTPGDPVMPIEPRWYERLDLTLWHDEAWRDPWVFRTDDGRFHTYLTARAASGDPTTRGVIGHAVSDDLRTWEVLPPVTEPGWFGHLEVPQVVFIGGWWWLLFCTPPAPASVTAEHPVAGADGTYALRAEDPLGPWDWSTLQVLDGDAEGSRYAGRLVETGDGWMLLSWLHRDGHGGFVGEIADPLPVTVSDGRLVVHR